MKMYKYDIFKDNYVYVCNKMYVINLDDVFS